MQKEIGKEAGYNRKDRGSKEPLEGGVGGGEFTMWAGEASQPAIMVAVSSGHFGVSHVFSWSTDCSYRADHGSACE